MWRPYSRLNVPARCGAKIIMIRGKRMGWSTRAAAAGMLACVIAPLAIGQEAPAPVVEGIRKFEPAYFAQFSPVTAQDMVRQLPGFFIDNGDSVRGFGATAGNVLIDGQRPTSKTAVSDELARIPARDIERIELIRASAAGNIDVRGYTELANVVLKPSQQVKESTTYTGQAVLNANKAGWLAGATRNWKASDFTARFNARVLRATPRAELDIETTNPSGAPISSRDEFNAQVLDELLLNGSISWSPTARDTVGITGRAMGRAFSRKFGSFNYDATGALTGLQTDDYVEKDIGHFDLGGDWEHKFSPESSLKLVAVNQLITWRPKELFESFNPAGMQIGATRLNNNLKRGEHVLRGVWTQKLGADLTVETGLEGAYNYRDQVRSILDSVNGGPFTTRALPITSTKVEEDRYEAFINSTWRANPQLTLEAGFNYEISTIRQTGDAQQERDFEYPKPHVVGTWTPTKEDQLRLSFERSVAQLDFGQFASNVQLTQGQLNIGNPNLEPEQIWATALQWKRSIGQRGSVAVTVNYNQIDDSQDLIPIRPAPNSAACQSNFNGPGCVFTASGNIGEAEMWGLKLEATLPLDDIGVKGGQLKFNGNWGDSRVTDPITGEQRRVDDAGTYDWNIDFRQDLPELKLAWGGDYSAAGEYPYFRLDEEQTFSYGPGDLDLFVETTYFDGVTVRLAGDNLGVQEQRLDRRFFTPNRFPGGVFSSREYQRLTNVSPTYTLTVSGSF